MAGALIGALRVTLGLDSAEFTAGTKKAQAEMTVFQRRMQTIGTGLKTAFAGVAAIGLSSIVTDAFAMASALQEAAAAAGVTVEQLQRLRLAAQQNGASADEMDAALQRLSAKLGEAQSGSKSAVAAFETLGLSMNQLKGLNSGDAFRLLVEKISAIKDPTLQAAAAKDIFGKSYANLLPLMKAGTAELDKATEASKRNGEISTADAAKLDELADGWDMLKTRLGVGVVNIIGDTARAAKAFDDFFKPVNQWAKEFDASVVRMAKNAVANLQNMVREIGAWITGALGRIWQGALDKIETVKRGFFNLYDAVVGNSYVPDMVDGIAAEMKRLDGVMVQPAAKATQSTKEKFRDMQQFVADLLAQLFPQAAEQNAIEAQILKLNAAFKAGAVKAETYSAAIEELNRQLRELRNGKEVNPEDDLANLPDGSDEVMVNGRKLLETLPKLSVATKTTFEGMARHVQNTAATIANAIADMQGALSGFISSIKKGDILGIIGGLANVIGSVLDAVGSGGSISSLFGGKKMPAYAGGTNFHPGGLALVGEKGAEIVDLPRGSKVFPHGTGPSAGAVVVQVQANDYFDAKVQRVSGNVVAQSAPSIVRASSQTAQGQLIRRSRRRLA